MYVPQPLIEGDAPEIRVKRIFQIHDMTHKVLYQYNKFFLKSFYAYKENVIILEYFLSLARSVLSPAGPLSRLASPLKEEKSQPKLTRPQVANQENRVANGSAFDFGDNNTD